MKKSSLFFVSLAIAVLIAYVKRPVAPHLTEKKQGEWKTFEKKSSDKIFTHLSTDKELEKAHIERKTASVTKQAEIPFSLREDRILTGEEIEKYKDESVELPMINKLNPEWKEALGNELMRFQKEDTKIIVKDELHLIKIQDGQGQYLEQVIVTYFFKNGDQNSFHALVNSETGAIVVTWDRTIHEQYGRKKQKLVPTGISNIIGR